MRPPPDSPVFSRSDALAFGWTDGALQRAVRSGRLIRLRRGYFAEPHRRGDPIAAAIAAVQACQGAVVSHRSAALVHGVPLVGRPPETPELTVAPRVTGDIGPGHLYRATLRPPDVSCLDGVPVTSVARTLVDLARTAWLPASVTAIDHALRGGLVDRASLYAAAARCKGWPRSRRIDPILALADERAESPLETCSRLMLAQLGLPTAQLQPDLRSLDGRFLGRADFYWDEFGVVGEADGRSKYTDRDVLVAEKLRQERMEEAGLVVVRWTWTDVRYETGDLKRRLERAFTRGRARDVSALPREWSVVPLGTGE